MKTVVHVPGLFFVVMRHSINFFYTDVQYCIMYMYCSHMSITLCLLITLSHEINSHKVNSHKVNSHKIIARQTTLQPQLLDLTRHNRQSSPRLVLFPDYFSYRFRNHKTQPQALQPLQWLIIYNMLISRNTTLHETPSMSYALAQNQQRFFT